MRMEGSAVATNRTFYREDDAPMQSNWIELLELVSGLRNLMKSFEQKSPSFACCHVVPPPTQSFVKRRGLGSRCLPEVYILEPTASCFRKDGKNADRPGGPNYCPTTSRGFVGPAYCYYHKET